MYSINSQSIVFQWRPHSVNTTKSSPCRSNVCFPFITGLSLLLGRMWLLSQAFSCSYQHALLLTRRHFQWFWNPLSVPGIWALHVCATNLPDRIHHWSVLFHSASTVGVCFTAGHQTVKCTVSFSHPGNGSWIPPPSDSLIFIPTSLDDAPQKNIWLFNITADPNERSDLSQSHPDVVKQLLERLAFYNSTAVPVRFPPNSISASPRFHGGVWGPWEWFIISYNFTCSGTPLKSQHKNLQSEVLSASNTSNLELPSSKRSQDNHSFCFQTSAEILSLLKILLNNLSPGAWRYSGSDSHFQSCFMH